METKEIQQLRDEADKLYRNDKLDQALDLYQEIVAVEPTDAWAYGRIGAIMAQWERLDEAEAALRQAIELDPKLSQVHSNLGNIFYARGDYQAALQKYQEAIAINPENPIFHANSHAAYKKLGKISNAVSAIKRSYKLERQVAKEEAKERFSATTRRFQRRLGCLPATLLLLGLLIAMTTALL